MIPFCVLKSVNGTFRTDYDQRAIIEFVLNEGGDVRNIADRLETQFGEPACQLRTIRFWIPEAGLGRQDFHDEICTVRLLLDDLDATILAILDKSPFESVHSIYETLSIAYSTILLHLHDSIDFRSFHLYWVPHLLMLDSREKRKAHARAMLPFLHAAEHDRWHHLVIGAKSWFSSIHHHVACGLCREIA
jgi:hypothetical protein